MSRESPSRPSKRPRFIKDEKMTLDEHPMVPVPDAIRTVLREAARILVTPKAKPNPSLVIPSDAPSLELFGKVLDEDVRMKEPGYPPYNASIMDGYAIRTSEFGTTTGADDAWTHHVVDKVYAGDGQAPKSASGDSQGLPPAYYITTGAVVPDSYDCVVPIEECVVSEDRQNIHIQSSAAIEANHWIRPIGCDIAAGSVVLPKGHALDPVALGLLKQSGCDSVLVKRPLVIGVLSTGNELILGPKDDASTPGKIPDVNRPILLSMLATFGSYCQPLDLGNERDDDVHAMAKTIDQALEKCDVIITTGGISMGETDIVEQVLVEHCGGKLHFGRMHMKPGKPTTFVSIPKGDAVRLVFAMPGNPVSATVCTQLLVRPCLDLLFHGVSNTSTVGSISDESLDKIVDAALVHPEIDAKLTHDIKLDQERPEYHRVTIERLPDGSFGVTTTGNQRSSRLMSCRDAQALLALPVGSPSKPSALKGEKYPVLSLGELRGINSLQLKDASHLRKAGRQAKIAVVEVVPKEKVGLSKLDETCARVEGALSGSKSGNAVVVSKKTFSDSLDKLYSEVIDCNGADLVVVSCVSFDGSFRYHLDVVAALRENLSKPAKALALQARQGAASENPTAALFEVVVGYAAEEQGSMVICLPDIGVSGGLSNVRGLLKHALNVARGKPHNHHHTHQHDHGKPQ